MPRCALIPHIERVVNETTKSANRRNFFDLGSLVRVDREAFIRINRSGAGETLPGTRWVLSVPQGAATRVGLNRANPYFGMKKFGIVRPGTESDQSEVRSGSWRINRSEILAGKLP
jgi:hypothetical protein